MDDPEEEVFDGCGTIIRILLAARQDSSPSESSKCRVLIMGLFQLFPEDDPAISSGTVSRTVCRTRRHLILPHVCGTVSQTR